MCDRIGSAAFSLLMAILTSVSAVAADRADRPGQDMVSGHAMPEIWFFLRGYATNPLKWHGVDGQQGWRKLFLEPDGPQTSVLDYVQVVALAGRITTPDDVYAKAFAKLREKHIKFAIEALALSWVGFPEKCGHGIESFTDPPGARLIANKIKAAGGELAYVTMDEPLFAGRYSNAQNACHDSVQTVAARAAAIMHEYQKVFPNVVIGDTEPFPALTKQPHWQAEYKEWMRVFQQEFGKPIAFLNIDLNWPEDNWNWQHSLKEASSFARAQGLPFGIIYNTSIPGGAKSDEQWLESAEDNFTQVEHRLGIIPDKALFESWAWYPKRTIGDASGPGEDQLVKHYLRSHGIEFP